MVLLRGIYCLRLQPQQGTLNDIYQLFCDFVLKNPFYETDQPVCLCRVRRPAQTLTAIAVQVRAAKFEVQLDKLLGRK